MRDQHSGIPLCAIVPYLHTSIRSFPCMYGSNPGVLGEHQRIITYLSLTYL